MKIFFRCVPLLLTFFTFPCTVSAHRLDEYLQATLVAIEPGNIRLQINLTPGVAVADKVLALIDRNHDGVISISEAAAYSELLKRDLVVRLDGREVKLKLAAPTLPAPDELRTGWGIILLEYSFSPSPLATGAHKLTLENRHLPAISVYLFNAELPRSHAIRITRQKRNETQSFGEIEFDYNPLKNAPNAS